MSMRRHMVAIAAFAIAFAGCSDGDETTPHDHDHGLLDPPPAGQGIQLRMQTRIEPGREVEHCQFFVGPAEGLNVQRDEVRFTTGSHHVLVYLTPYAELPDKDELGDAVDVTQPFDCSDGPTARFRVSTLIGGSQNANGDSIVEFPEDVGMKVPPNSVLLVNAHYINTGSEEIQPEVRVNLHSIADSRMRAEGGVLFWYNPFILVGPHAEAKATMSCPLAADIRIGNGQSHMHRRGVGYLAEHIAPDGKRTKIYDNTRWADVPVQRWDGGLEIPAGSRIEYGCSYRNDEDRQVWQGPRTSDEMCMFIGSYWPARPEISLCAMDPDNALDTQDLAADWVGDGGADCKATLACIQTAASGAGDEIMHAVTECVLGARAESSALVSDLVRCMFVSNDPEAECATEMGACTAE